MTTRKIPVLSASMLIGRTVRNYTEKDHIGGVVVDTFVNGDGGFCLVIEVPAGSWCKAGGTLLEVLTVGEALFEDGRVLNV